MKSGQDIGRLDANMAVPDVGDGLLWYDIRALGVEGRAWDDTENYYDRLPAKAAGMVPWRAPGHASYAADRRERPGSLRKTGPPMAVGRAGNPDPVSLMRRNASR